MRCRIPLWSCALYKPFLLWEVLWASGTFSLQQGSQHQLFRFKTLLARPPSLICKRAGCYGIKDTYEIKGTWDQRSFISSDILFISRWSLVKGRSSHVLFQEHMTRLQTASVEEIRTSPGNDYFISASVSSLALLRHLLKGPSWPDQSQQQDQLLYIVLSFCIK